VSAAVATANWPARSLAVIAVAIGVLGVYRDAGAAAVLRVGAEELLKLPSAAAQLAHDGDTVEIQAGIYEGDAAVWRQNGLTLRGVGGSAHMSANGAHAEGKAIWVIKGANTVIENVEFSGARVPDRNGAGIRVEGPGLLVRRCYFHHNENGILVGANPNSQIVVEHSEFAYNGFGDGQSHNLYIGTVSSFTLRYSYAHHAVVGHDVKSRALKSYITYNRIMDEGDGRSSYSIDLPDGGLSFVIGNVIQQGRANENRTIVAPLEHQSSKAQVEPALQLLALTVAIKTMRLEDRPDILLEHWGGGVRSGNNQQEETERTEKP